MKINLERLFGTSLRVRLLVHFLGSSKRPYSLSELRTKLRDSKRKIQKELINLKGLGLIIFSQKDKKPFFILNMRFPIYKELKAFIFKVTRLPEDKMFRKLKRMGRIKYAVLTGFFTQAKGAQTDILIVGRVNSKRLQSFIKRIERQIGREINYTIMTPNEFSYRTTAGDQFISKIKENEHIVVINTFAREKKKSKK